MKHVAQLVMAGKYDAAMAFFKQEYLTDAVISQLSIPHISLLDGITMGGGAGVSMHGHFRVATERCVLILLSPDPNKYALHLAWQQVFYQVAIHIYAWLQILVAL